MNQQTHELLPKNRFGHQKTSELFETLSQRRGGRHVPNEKISVLTIRFDMIKIRFSCCKQADHRADDVAMGNVQISTNRWELKGVCSFIQFHLME
ncbi:hypothetical protein HNQ84_001266 [Anoxybacillus eryuanensis]|uniref:Uncharacterized protein n=1 Tax=Anoxybacillus tengchongensis TaxID=576944 RepID=A0A7W9YTP9_9BACL|nr:hypothetical protein [Anoxybacillus tengchongensis]